MSVNKVIYGTDVLIDLTSDTVTPNALLNGFTAHDKSGNIINGTLEQSGVSSKNVQFYKGIGYVRATSYTSTDVSITVEKSGTYNISWIGFRQSTGGTNGSQLYINGSAYGSSNTSFTSSYSQSNTLSNVSLNEGDVIVVRARSRSTSYYMFVGGLIIEEV
ncbi:hypothetical protein [Floccifex sp.]|uniref:hypothetical protein n=1 Tax=Floccifex sp. TaxID=2815810 RepID=UPI003EFD1453